MWLDLNLLEVFVHTFLPGLNKNNKKSYYFSIEKLYPHFNPKNAKILFMNVYPLICTKIQVFFIKILSEIEFLNFIAF